MDIFRNSKKNANIAKSVKSRYNYEILNTAYSNIWYYREVTMLTIPVNTPDTDEVEVYFHTPKEIADALMIDFFNILPLVDVIVQEDDMDNYDISYFSIYDEKVEIGYIGNKVNTNFDVKVFKNDGQWYCAEIGMRKFTPPKCIDCSK